MELAVEITETSKTGMFGSSHYDVIENFDFQKLTCSDEITGDFNVRL